MHCDRGVFVGCEFFIAYPSGAGSYAHLVMLTLLLFCRFEDSFPGKELSNKSFQRHFKCKRSAAPSS